MSDETTEGTEIEELLAYERRVGELASLLQAMSIIVGTHHQKCPPEVMAAYEHVKLVACATVVHFHAAALRGVKKANP